MKAGDKVYYLRENKGGYGYAHKYPAIVVKVNPKTVKIRMARIVKNSMEAFTSTVKFERLSERKTDCGFESVLQGSSNCEY